MKEATMSYRLVAVLAAVFATSSLALVQSAFAEPGFYAKAYAGASKLSDTTLTIDNARSKGKFGSGTLVGGAVGYDYEGPWKSEVEYTYRSSSLNRLAGAVARKSDYASTSIMLNGLYALGDASSLKPYVGLGIGFTREVDFDLNAGASPGQYSKSSLFAYQGIVGIEFEFSEDWSGFGQLRTFSVNSPTLKGGNRTLKADYRTTDLVIGISRKF